MADKPWEDYQAKDPNQPPPQAIGTPNGATPAAQSKPWEDYGEKFDFNKQAASDPNSVAYNGQEKNDPIARNPLVQGLKRITSIPAGVTRVAATGAVGNLLPSANGKNMAENSDYWDALAGHAPGVGDMAARKYPGLGDGLKKVLNVGGNVALDPLMWGGFQKAGKSLYNSAINPIEVEGQLRDKGSVGDILNKHGIMSENDLRNKGQQIVDSNAQNITDPMEQGATDAKVEADMHRATAPAQAHVDRIMEHAIPGSKEYETAQQMQVEINLKRKMQGTTASVRTEFQPKPEEPYFETPTESTGRLEQNQVTNRMDAQGQPIVNTKPLAKRPGLPVVNDGPVPGPVVAGAKPPFVDPAESLSAIDQLKRSDLEKVIGRVRGIEPPVRTEFTPQPPATEMTTDRMGKWVPGSNQDNIGSLPQGGDYVPVKTDGVQGPSANATSRWKSDAYNDAGTKAYDPGVHASSWQDFYKKMGFGMKEATEKAIEKVYGPDGLAKYQQANAESGAILSTGKVQGKVAAQRARDMGIATSIVPSATEVIPSVTAGGASGSATNAGLTGLALRGWRGAKLARMPVGYIMRNTPQAATQAASIINNSNPWAPPKQGDQ